MLHIVFVMNIENSLNIIIMYVIIPPIAIQPKCLGGFVIKLSWGT